MSLRCWLCLFGGNVHRVVQMVRDYRCLVATARFPILEIIWFRNGKRASGSGSKDCVNRQGNVFRGFKGLLVDDLWEGATLREVLGSVNGWYCRVQLTFSQSEISVKFRDQHYKSSDLTWGIRTQSSSAIAIIYLMLLNLLSYTNLVLIQT